MSAVNEIVTVNTTVQDSAVTADGFGVPMILCAHGFWADRVKSFGSITEAETAGVTSGHHLHRKLSGFFAQNPRPPSVKVGLRRAAAYTHTVELTVPATTDGDVASLTINAVSYQAAQAAGDKAGPLDAVINAISGISSTEAAGVITVVSDTADVLMELADLVGCTIKDVTADTGIAADLAAVEAADGDWYLGVIDGHSEVQINAAAVAITTLGKLGMFVSQDDEILDAGETADIASDLNTAGLSRAPIMYHTKPVEQCGDARWSGMMLPLDPGSANWANQSPEGLDRLTLSTGQIAAAKAKKANVYVNIKGLGFTLWGWAPSGRYLDITRGMDWFDTRLAERMLNLQANAAKIPYTDGGMIQLEAQLRAQIAAGQRVTLIAEDPAPVINTPLVSTASQSDKTNRIAPSIDFNFTLQGAVQSVTYNGSATL